MNLKNSNDNQSTVFLDDDRDGSQIGSFSILSLNHIFPISKFLIPLGWFDDRPRAKEMSKITVINSTFSHSLATMRKRRLCSIVVDKMSTSGPADPVSEPALSGGRGHVKWNALVWMDEWRERSRLTKRDSGRQHPSSQAHQATSANNALEHNQKVAGRRPIIIVRALERPMMNPGSPEFFVVASPTCCREICEHIED